MMEDKRMAFPLTLLDLAGAIALLLWGSHMVQTGVQRAFGPRLRGFLESALRNRGRAFLAGLGVTALLQSSTATGLMTAGFAATGLVDLAPALAVMLGANVGTTLVAQLFSFHVAALSPILILTGVMMFRRDRNGVPRDLGRAFIGLGLMFLALSQLLDLMTQYEDSPSLRLLLGALSTEPLIDILLGAVLTWAAHSSVAVVLFIMSLATRGVVPPDAAFALVIGANIGAAVNPVLEGPGGDDPAAKRLPVGNLLTRLVGGALALGFLYPVGRFMVGLQPDVARVVVDFHTLFNLAIAALFFPFLGAYAALLERLFPSRVDPADPAVPVYLDPTARETPIVALGAAAREGLRLADLFADMLSGTRAAVDRSDRRLAIETRRRDDKVDRLAGAIKAYVASLDNEDASDADQRRAGEVLTFVAQIEQASDILARTVLPDIARYLKKSVAVEESDRTEVLAAMDRAANNLRSACSLLMTDDPRVARILIEEKIAFRDAEARAAQDHFATIGAAPAESAPPPSLRLDLLRALKQINSHIVAAAAYPVLEREGELLPSRVFRAGP
jgi:phosphate:Na+ symporter